jgi:hypothetical protein
VRWEKQTDTFGFPTYTPVYTPVSSSDLVTGPDGKARLSFTPPSAGTYMLDVSGGGARSQTLIWVGGAGSAAWPELPDQRIELTADRESYQAGDAANIFIPNPFAVNALALITVERGLVSKAEVVNRRSGRVRSATHRGWRAECLRDSYPAGAERVRYGLINLPVRDAVVDASDSNPPKRNAMM